MRHAVAVFAGALFALGLVIADMTSPARVIAFLDLRHWDPTLAFVMGGAIAIYAPIAYWARDRSTPRFGGRFEWSQATAIDLRLVLGAAIFGVGWGLSGYCPGPALVAAGAAATPTLVFVGALIAGLAIARRLMRE